MKEERLLRAMTEIDAQLIQAHAPDSMAKSATSGRYWGTGITCISL